VREGDRKRVGERQEEEAQKEEELGNPQFFITTNQLQTSGVRSQPFGALNS